MADHSKSSPNSFSKSNSRNEPVAPFQAALASGYQPKPQTSVSAQNHLATHDQSKLKPLSSFAASAYATATDTTIPLQAMAPQPIDLNSFTNLQFITFDELQTETRAIYEDISGGCKWKMFESQKDSCISFIYNECADKRVFLISSGSLGKALVPQIHNLSQLYAIYIYCSDIKYHQEWAYKFSKVRVVCNNDDMYLLPQLAVDVAQANIDWGNALLKQQKHNEAKQRFEEALKNLTKHAKNPDPTMVTQVTNKLEECK